MGQAQVSHCWSREEKGTKQLRVTAHWHAQAGIKMPPAGEMTQQLRALKFQAMPLMHDKFQRVKIYYS